MANLEIKQMKYIAKPNTWFDEGTEATVEGELYGMGTCVDDETGKRCDGHKSGVFAGIKNGSRDEELCCECEFEVIDE